MTPQDDFHPGRRVSYDGALCTVRLACAHIPGTKGEWLGVEWDDSRRGKHNGALDGVRYFQCRSSHPAVASFVRPTRKQDDERTLIEAIRYKYAADQPENVMSDVVTFSGKVAEEIGFDKIIKAQSILEDLKIIILDHLTIHGLSIRGSSKDVIKRAQNELANTCPNVIELDLSHNPIEDWADIEDICIALPKLRVLKLNVRFRDIASRGQDLSRSCFPNLQELHLNECLLTTAEILHILGRKGSTNFPSLRTLWLSQNELSRLLVPEQQFSQDFSSVKTLMFENNLLTTLDPLIPILALFPKATHISLQSNKIESFGSNLSESTQKYPSLTSLNLSQNQITSFSFIDLLQGTFPNLSSLRLSGNPVYGGTGSAEFASKPIDTSYYLTLARIPTLKTLNYTEITPREREEGEIYYLSMAEKDVRTTLANLDQKDQSILTKLATLQTHYSRYESLCLKHDRDNLITQFTSASSSTTSNQISLPTSQQTHPPGSLLSRIVATTFYIAPQPISSSPSPSTIFTHQIPKTTPTTSVFALVSRTLNLPSLSFKLIYESDELDPVRDDLTTRSQIYAGGKKAEKRWDDWGDWDADELVERSANEHKGQDEGGDQGRWTEDGILVKDGRKWRKREVNVLFSMRDWGDWLEDGVSVCKVRVEPI